MKLVLVLNVTLRSSNSKSILHFYIYVRGFTKFGIKVHIVEAKGSGILEDLTFRILEGSDPKLKLS